MPDVLERLKAALADRYIIERELGAGGMATVYLAEDVKHNRKVAVKVLKPELAASVGAERFLREIQIAAQLTHPNILTLIDSGDADGLLYYVMPYVEGESLRERLNREKQLPLEDAVQITREVADALSVAHSQGVIHRDIKPGNILLEAGHAVVADFGIARAITTAGGEQLTETGIAVGTPTYMSPEQASGQKELDPRSDVYSLGCVLYEMLGGEPPYTGATPQAILARKAIEPVPSLRPVRATIPVAVEDAVTKALEKVPADRFATAGAFAEALTETALRASTLRPAGAGAVTGRARRRRIAGAVGLVVVAAAAWWLSTRAGVPAIERLAVLPLDNRMSDPDQDFFLAGVHRDLVLELAKAGVRVINPTSVLQYQNSDMPVREIAQELGVDGVIQGSASRAGDSVGIELRLVDGATDELLWFDSYGGEMKNVLALYREATRAIAREIDLDLSQAAEARLASAPPVDPQVYEALQQGRFHREKQTPEGLQTALDYFELALDKDPENAAAYAGIAGVWDARSIAGFVSTEEATREANAALAKAIQLDSTLAAVQVKLAGTKTWGEWDWEGGEAAFQRALAADPTDSRARRNYSHLLLYLGRSEEARAQIERAMELDPFNAMVQGFYGMYLNFTHRYDAAVAQLRNTLARTPNDPMALSTLRTTYHLMGRHEDALDMWRASFAARGDHEAGEALERGYREGGYSGALRSVAERMVERSQTTHVTPWQIGTLYTRAGDTEKAIESLEQAFEARERNMPYLSVDPIFDYMRDDPRFQDLLRRMNLLR